MAGADRLEPVVTLLLVGLLAVLATPAATPEPEVLAAQARQAAQKGDHAGAARLLQQATVALPNSASLLVDLATSQARLDQHAAAVETLGRAAAMGAGTDLAALDAAMGPAASRPDYLAVRRRFEENVAPLARSAVAFRLDPRLLPESLAHDPAQNAFYVGSMHQRKIVRVEPGPGGSVTVRDLVGPARDGLFGVIGIKLDAARRELWAASCNGGNDPPMDPPDPATANQGALYRYALPADRTAEARLIKKYPFPASVGRPEDWRCFNDMVLDPAGNVYLSAGPNGALRLDRARDVLEPFVAGPGLFVNGIAISDDGRTVFLAAHARGVVRVDAASRRVQPLTLPAEATLAGIDGLYVRGRMLIGVQNALRHGPHRVVRAWLDPTLERAERVEVLERAHPDYAVPTTGVLVGDDFYYVAASNLEAVDEQGRLAPEKLKDTVILRLPLGASPSADRQSDTEELLRMHARGREAHFETDAEKLLSHGAETMISVNGGRIQHITRAQQREFFTGYFKGARYFEWDDLEPPIVRVSGDGSMAWMITRTRVRRTQPDAAGVAKEVSFVYAGIMTYEKRDGRWVRVANVSTFEPAG
jgi:hypothetical protein